MFIIRQRKIFEVMFHLLYFKVKLQAEQIGAIQLTYSFLEQNLPLLFRNMIGLIAHLVEKLKLTFTLLGKAF